MQRRSKKNPKKPKRMKRLKNKIFLFTHLSRGDAGAESKKLARAASAEYFLRLGLDPEEIFYEKSGKPVFPSGEHHLSISHAGSFFAAAFAPFPIGIDAEPEDLDARERIAEKYFDQEEKKEPFSRIWTAKEAVSKIGGEGISALRSISVRGEIALFAGKRYRLLDRSEKGYKITIAIPDRGEKE